MLLNKFLYNDEILVLCFFLLLIIGCNNGNLDRLLDTGDKLVVDNDLCPQFSECDDGILCTKDDVCLDGKCIGEMYFCDDENVCTQDSCDGFGGCVYTEFDCPEDLPPEETKWVGWYSCNGAQGKTALNLFTTRDTETDAMSAIFAFSEHPENLGIPSGSFTLLGRYDAQNKTMFLLPNEWIENPGNWNMVGLKGEYDQYARQIHGEITDPEGDPSFICETFDLDREEEDIPE